MTITPNNYPDFKAIANTAGALSGVFYSAALLWAYSRTSGDSIVIVLTGATNATQIVADFPAAIALTDMVAFSP